MGTNVTMPKLLILSVVGAAIAFGLERFLGSDHGSGSLLINLVFWTGMATGCVAVMAAAEVAHATWHKPLFRRMVVAHAYFPVVLVFFLVYATQVDQYPWAGEGGRWLNKPFFIGRHIFLLLVGWGIARRFIALVLRGVDASRRWAVLYCFFFMAYMSMVGLEWVMSLEKPWFSTLFGAWFMVSAWLSAVCAAAVILFRMRGQLDDPLKYAQKSIGGLMFGFATFWAYFYFSQLIVIWYGNMPEETTYLARRIGYHTPYWFLARLIFTMVWVIPFATLLSRANKTRPPVTVTLAAIICTGLLAEFWLCIHPVVPVNLLAAVVEFAVMGFLFVSVMRSSAELVPEGTPAAVPAGAAPAH